jgi:hypothetical protein
VAAFACASIAVAQGCSEEVATQGQRLEDYTGNFERPRAELEATYQELMNSYNDCIRSAECPPDLKARIAAAIERLREECERVEATCPGIEHSEK